MEASFVTQRVVGQLVEARVYRLSGPLDVAKYEAAFPPLLRGVDDPVLCADHRPVAIYPQAVADRLTEIFLNFNRKWRRVAILASPTNATLVMQLQRLIREANNPSRKLFFSGAEAAAFLGEVLEPAERTRLAEFVAEYRPSKPPSR